MTKPGNALLDAFADLGQFDFPYGDFENTMFDGHPMKASKLPRFTEESFTPLEHERHDGLGWHNGEPFQEGQGVHELAWYVPRYRRMQWGIYFSLPRMMEYVAFVHRAVERIRPVAISEVANVVWAQVLRHEIEHCVHELVIAKAATGANPPHNLQNAIMNASRAETEALATHQEITDFISPISSRANSGLITHVVALLSKPGPYDLWDKIDVNYEERMYAHNFGFYPSIDNPCEDFRKLIDGRASSAYITIPIYIIASDRDNFGHWAAAFGISEKRFAKKIMNPGAAGDIDPRLSVDVGSGFEIVISHSASSETLVLDLSSETLLSAEKFSKLASMCGMATEMLSSMTRYWFI
ncbi:MAG: hypothetical protein RL085_876 [Actinomycetota bacterium]|jgi:hypothetical protein